MSARRARPAGAPTPPRFITDSHSHWIQESQILLPVDKALPDSEWPIFTLRDVTVWSHDGLAYGDLLYIEKKGPFIVRGHLSIDHSSQQQVNALVKRTFRETHVEVKAFRMSIGWGEGPELWAASDYGFFLISHTTCEYSPVFAKTSQAISLYYTVMFIYEEEMDKAKKKKKNVMKMPVEELLLKYAVAIGDGITYEDAVQRCTQHSQFVATHCPKEEQFDWDSTEFYRWIQSLAKKSRPPPSYPVPQPVQQAAAPRGGSSAPSAVHSYPLAKRGRSSSTMEDNATNRSLTPGLSRRGKGARQSPAMHDVSTPVVPVAAPAGLAQTQLPAASMAYIPGEVLEDSYAGRLYDTLVDLFEADPHGGIKKATVAGAGTKMYMGCRFRAYTGPRDMIKYYAKHLVTHMENDSGRASEWKKTKMYAELQEHVKKPTATLFSITPDLFDHSLTRRKPKNPDPSTVQAEETSKPESNIQTDSMDVDDPSDSSQLEKSRGRRSGKVAGLRLVTASSKKRPGPDLDAAGLGHKGAKGLKRARYFENGNDSDNGNDEEESDGSDEIPSDGEPDQELVQLAIHAEPLPSKKPDFNGIWTCQEEDCGCVIYDADEPDGQAEVDDHIYSHQDQIDLINLARVEGRDSHRPYAHLIQKLIDIGAKKVAKKRDEELDRPRPIKRALPD